MSVAGGKAPLRIAIAGLGTVGTGVLRLLERHAVLLSQRCDREIKVVAVSARDRSKNRELDISGIDWWDDAPAMAREVSADVVVELIGGSDGIAKAVVEAGIDAGRAVVTANKALIAHHGIEMARRAEHAAVAFNYEAAVAGGIPIIKALREGLAGNQVRSLHAILNGTCNFILTQMEATGQDFDKILAEAQRLGYAEADPSFDIGGIDAAHKLAILSSLAFGCTMDFDGLYIEGIEQITADDIRYAAELGYRIKLLAIARETGAGIEQRVHPAMVPLGTALADVDGVFNAIVADGDFVGQTVFEGAGAGAGATASAVVADIVDIARGLRVPVFGVPTDLLEEMPPAPMRDRVGAYFVRLTVFDKPGVMASVTAELAKQAVSIDSILQRGRAPGEAVPVVMVTHETRESAMLEALEAIGQLEENAQPPRLIRIERF